MPVPDKLQLVGYTDSDFAAHPLQRRSRGGYIFHLGDHGACSYKSTLMPTATQEPGGGIAQSTVEAETVALANANAVRTASTLRPSSPKFSAVPCSHYLCGKTARARSAMLTMPSSANARSIST